MGCLSLSATARRFAERSKREYRDDVSGVVEYLQDRWHVRSATMVQRQHLTGYLGHCSALGYATGTRRRSVAAIRCCFAFLVEEGTIRYSPPNTCRRSAGNVRRAS